MIQVRDLRLVEAIAEHGSLARAGRVLGVAGRRHIASVPSRATTRPPDTTSFRAGRATTASARLRASTSTRSARDPGSSP